MKKSITILLLLTVAVISLNIGIYIGRSNKDGTIESYVEKRPDNVGKLNLNTANWSELSMIPGLSESLSRRIIDFREDHGDFKTIYDLLDVTGISYKVLEDIQDYVYVE